MGSLHCSNRVAVGLLLVIGLAAIGCGPSQEDLDRALAHGRQLQAQLQDSQHARDALQRHLQALQGQNQQMADRLRALGQNVEALQGERSNLQSSLQETQRALAELRAREQQAQARLQTFRDLLARFRSMIASGRLRVRVVRNRMVVELPEGVLFDSGKAKLKDSGKSTLSQVGQVLSSIPNRQFQIAGHTDNIPIHTHRFPSNWELSTARAVEVARYLIDQGITADRLSAAGYADTQPVADNDTADGRAQNRRIEIVLVPNLNELPDLSSLQDLEGGASGSGTSSTPPAGNSPAAGGGASASPN